MAPPTSEELALERWSLASVGFCLPPHFLLETEEEERQREIRQRKVLRQVQKEAEKEDQERRKAQRELEATQRKAEKLKRSQEAEEERKRKEEDQERRKAQRELEAAQRKADKLKRSQEAEEERKRKEEDTEKRKAQRDLEAAQRKAEKLKRLLEAKEKKQREEKEKKEKKGKAMSERSTPAPWCPDPSDAPWSHPQTSDEVAALLDPTSGRRLTALEHSALLHFCSARRLPRLPEAILREILGPAPWAVSTGDIGSRVMSGEHELTFPSAKALQLVLLDLEPQELVSLAEAPELRGVCLDVPCFVTRVAPGKRARDEDAEGPASKRPREEAVRSW